MVPVLLLASLIWSVTQSQDHVHHVTQDTTPTVGNVSIMTYSGGRRKGMEFGCHELRSKRYISDGLCTTPKPINEVVCADWCIMPPGQMPGQQSSTFMSKIHWQEWTTRQKQKKSSSVIPNPFLISNDTIATLSPQKWRCVDGVSKKRRVTLICKDGSRRVYRVKVVKRCKCTKRQEQKRQDKSKKTRRLDRSKKRSA